MNTNLPPNCLRLLETTRVAVVGGGLAGLMAARILKQHRIKSTVFEARSRLGGRVWSDEKFSNGRITEFGAELIGSFFTTWLELAHQYGLAVISRMDESHYERTGMRVGEDIKLNKEMNFRVLRPIAVEAEKIKDPSRPWDEPKDIQKWDEVSVKDALKDYIRDPKDPLWKAVEARFVNTELGPLEEMNYLGLLCKVRAAQKIKPFESDEPDPHDPKALILMRYWNELEIFRSADGCQMLAEALANEIGRTTIKLHRAVTHIDFSKKGGVDLTHRRVINERPIGDPKAEHFDYVILTIPPSVWDGVTITANKGKEPVTLPGRVKMGNAVKYFADLKERFWTRSERRTAPLGGSMKLGQVWECTDNQTRRVIKRGFPNENDQGIVLGVYAGPIRPGPSVPTKDQCKEQLELRYPGPNGFAENLNKAKFIDWPNEPFIKTGFAAPKVGEFLKFAKVLSEPFRNLLFFAGEYTQTDFFGYMEGALRSGDRAAKALIMHRCGQPGKPYPNPPGGRTAGEAPMQESPASEYKSEVIPEMQLPIPDEFESPFLDRNLFAAEVKQGWEPRAEVLLAESPFSNALEPGGPVLIEPEELDEDESIDEESYGAQFDNETEEMDEEETDTSILEAVDEMERLEFESAEPDDASIDEITELDGNDTDDEEAGDERLFEAFAPPVSQADLRTRIDEFLGLANAEYTIPAHTVRAHTDQHGTRVAATPVRESKVKALPQFHYARRQSGETKPQQEKRIENAAIKVRAILGAKFEKDHPRAIHNAAWGRPKPRELATITQGLIDKGELDAIRKDHPATMPNRQLVRELQRNFQIGIDCAGYVQLAFIHAFLGHDNDTEKVRVSLGLRKRRGDEKLADLPRSHFKPIAVTDAQTGDLFVLKPRSDDDGSWHTVIIVQHDVSPGGVHTFLVDASWGRLYGPKISGVHRRRFRFDPATQLWWDVHQPDRSIKFHENPIGPYNGHPIHGMFRARQK